MFWATGLGKGQKLDDVVLTPDGFTKVRDVSLGDTLYDQDGDETSVVGIYPQPELPEWKVTFNDGTEIYTTPQHEWTVRTKYHAYRARQDGRPRWRTLETQEMAEDESKWQVPKVDTVEHSEADLPVDPYIYGVLLAEGTVSDYSTVFVSGDSEIVTEMQSRLPEGFEIRSRKAKYTYSIVGGYHNRLRSVGLYDTISYRKKIDSRYIYASPSQRLDLLRGLMDGDGTVSSEGVGHFSSSSRKLADGVCQLVRSFGGRTRVRKNASSLNGKRMADRFRVRVNLDVNPFFLPRKAAAYNTDVKQGKSIIIRSVEPTGRMIKTRCFEVDSAQSTYLTRDYKVTHNSSGCLMHLPLRFEEMVEEHGMLFLCHRRKILFQSFAKFKRAYPSLWVGIEMGELTAQGDEDVVFASVESVGREYQTRIEKYSHRKFGIVVCDEGHHVTRDGTWDRILNYFGVGSDPSSHYTIDVGGKKRKPLSLFLTATPNRADDQTLAPFVDEVAHEMSIEDGVRAGWLTDIKSERANPGKDFNNEQDELNFLVKTYKKYLTDEKTLAFCRTVEQSKRFATHINEHGIARAAHIDAETPKEDRKRIWTQFENGDVDVLTNVLVATEGVDVPTITAILDNAPTESKPLAIQKIGRGLRPHPDAKVDSYDTPEERREAIRQSPKPYLWYVATFNPHKHGLDITAQITEREGEMPDPEGRLLIEEVVDVLEEFETEMGEYDLATMDTISEVEVTLSSVNIWTRTIENDDLKALTRLKWIVGEDSASIWMERNPFANTSRYSSAPVAIDIIEDENGIKARYMAGGWNGSYAAGIKVHEQEVNADDLDEAITKVDRWLKSKDSDMYHRLQRSGSLPASDQQKQYLKRKKVPFKEPISEETAELLIVNEKIKQRRESANKKVNDG